MSNLKILTLILSWSLFMTPLVAEAKSVPNSEKIAEETELLDRQKDFIDQHIAWAIQLGDECEQEYGGKPPITAVLAQSALESEWRQSNFCLYHLNDFGIGGRKDPWDFESHYKSWVEYYRLVATREGYVQNGSLEADNTYEYITALIAGGYCDDYGYLREVLKIANKIKPYVIAKEAEVRAEQEAVYETSRRPKFDVREKLIRQIGELDEITD